MNSQGSDDGSAPIPASAARAASASGDRLLKAAAPRVLVIGLDGAVWTILKPMIAAGRLPRLAAAVASGASGLLRSTTPALTPAAWTTFLTGKQPGSHGIIDFEQYDHFTNEFRFNSARCRDHVRNIWQILGDRGLKVGSINVPMTYPPMPINGFMISGFETPGPESDFVYPLDLKSEILQRWPDPTQRSKWKRKTFGGLKLFRENVDYMARSFHQGAEMTMHLGDKFGWDALMVVLKLVDNLQHKTWKYLDPRWPQRDRAKREIVVRCFEEMDKAVGTLLDYAKAHDAAVMIVSDHGHGSLEGKAHPNCLLQRWGYLALHAGAVPEGEAEKRPHIGDVEKALPVDYSKTRACVMHAGNAGFLYINLKGRQPTGIVDPQDYEELRDALIARLQGEECRVRNPRGEMISLFPEVVKPEEAYGCRREDQPWLPDLLLIPHETLSVVRRIRGNALVKWFSYRRMEGTHRQDGIFIAAGPGIKHLDGLHPHIVDCAPTLMAMLGLPVPEDMEGRVIGELFEREPVIEKEAVKPRRQIVSGKPAAPDSAYSLEDMQKVTDRLSDLGYLE